MDNEERLRRRRREKRRQEQRRRMIRLCIYVAAVILVLVFLIKVVFIPLFSRSGSSKSTGQSTAAASGITAILNGDSADDSSSETTSTSITQTAAVRKPLKSSSDSTKITALTTGWHDDDNGSWYQNPDGTYYASGFADIGDDTYYFDANGYRQTGWVSEGAMDYYFNDDGTYDPNTKKKLLCLTFDDGPGEYTDELLDVVEEYNVHVTFFMLGQLVSSYPEEVQRMVNLGCELGNHSWDHTQLTTISIDEVAKQYEDTDNALIEACGQAATVGRAPYGDGNTEIYETVGKPFAMWSLDSLDWSYLDADLDYDAVINGDLTDGSIILMHDIHEQSVEAAKRIIPELVAEGYKLVTFSEMAAAKNVTLQNTVYTDFWPSSLEAGIVAGYNGGAVTSSDSSDESAGDGSDEDYFDDSSDDSEEDYSEDDYSEEDYSEDDSE